jgi:hypothetical protein
MKILAALSRVLPPVLAGAAVGLVLAPVSGLASNHWAYQEPGHMDFGQGDYVYNYDFREGSTWSKYKVDWPITFIAYNSATVNKLKTVMEQFAYDQAGGSMYGHVNDGPESSHYLIQDTDSGKKHDFCPGVGNETPHFRVYADGNDYLWQIGRGSYVVASTHRDVEECSSFKIFRDSEQVEGGIVTNLSNLYYVYHDRYAWGNPEPYRVQGRHIWDNNGYGSYVEMT